MKKSVFTFYLYCSLSPCDSSRSEFSFWALIPFTRSIGFRYCRSGFGPHRVPRLVPSFLSFHFSSSRPGAARSAHHKVPVFHSWAGITGQVSPGQIDSRALLFLASPEECPEISFSPLVCVGLVLGCRVRERLVQILPRPLVSRFWCTWFFCRWFPFVLDVSRSMCPQPGQHSHTGARLVRWQDRSSARLPASLSCCRRWTFSFLLAAPILCCLMFVLCIWEMLRFV
jgi:hypothetical protein